MWKIVKFRIILNSKNCEMWKIVEFEKFLNSGKFFNSENL